MAAISIFALTTFFSNEPKSISRGENHYKSGHIESFSYSDRVLRGSVHASMKNKSYKVTVSIDIKLEAIVRVRVVYVIIDCRSARFFRKRNGYYINTYLL